MFTYITGTRNGYVLRLHVFTVPFQQPAIATIVAETNRSFIWNEIKKKCKYEKSDR